MRFPLIVAAIVLSLTACDKGKSEQKAAQDKNLPTADVKFDLKGLYPGMSKDEVTSNFKDFSCLPAADILRGFEADLAEAEKIAAIMKQPGVKESDLPPPDVRERAKSTIQMKESGEYENFKKIASGTIDTVCILEESAGQTYANLPAAVEVQLKNGKAKFVSFKVRGARTDDLIKGLALKYNWITQEQNGMEQNANLMSISLGLHQGVVDKNGNTLYVESTPDRGTIFVLKDPEHKAAAASMIADKEKNKTGAKDM